MGMGKLKPTYFESIRQCSAMLGIPEHKLKAWKAAGCRAFRYSRVYHADLLGWLKDKGGESAAKPGSDEPPASHWQREKARVDYERALFSLEVEKKKHVELDEVCAAVGQMLAGFRTAINMLPGSAARWLIGLKDFHVIKAKLQTEVDSALNSLGRCRYLEDLAPAVIEKLFSDRSPEFRQGLEKCCAQVSIELGRECFKELQINLPTENETA